MTVKYIDSAELVEVLNIPKGKHDNKVDSVKYYILLLLELGVSRKKKDIKLIRVWLNNFIKNPMCVGNLNNYIHIWKSILHIEDDETFLKLMLRNVDLMWD